MDRLVDALATGENVNPTEALFRMALNFVLITCFGRNTSTMEDDDENKKTSQDAIYEELSAVLKRSNSFTGIRNNFTTYLPALSFLDSTFLKTEQTYQEFIENERDPLYRKLIKETLQHGEECVVKSLSDMKEMGQLDDDDILVTAGMLIIAALTIQILHPASGFGNRRYRNHGNHFAVGIRYFVDPTRSARKNSRRTG